MRTALAKVTNQEAQGVLKVAVTLLAWVIDTTQFPVPVHAPDEPVNVEPAAAAAVKVTRLPSIARNIVRIRNHPYMLFVTLYTIGFIVAFSAIFNLGILARQRTQVLPFLLAALVGLGWAHIRRPREQGPEDDVPATVVAALGQELRPVGFHHVKNGLKEGKGCGSRGWVRSLTGQGIPWTKRRMTVTASPLTEHRVQVGCHCGRRGGSARRDPRL